MRPALAQRARSRTRAAIRRRRRHRTAGGSSKGRRRVKHEGSKPYTLRGARQTREDGGGVALCRVAVQRLQPLVHLPTRGPSVTRGDPSLRGPVEGG